MMKSVFWNKVLLICVFGCLLNCTYDTNIDLTEEVVEKSTTKGGAIYKKMDALVVFKKGTSASAKRKIRGNYVKSGLLLSWESCLISTTIRPGNIENPSYESDSDNNDDDNDGNDDNDGDDVPNEANQVEVWVLNAEVYYMGDPVVLVETENEEIEKFVAFANCKDYKEK